MENSTFRQDNYTFSSEKQFKHYHIVFYPVPTEWLLNCYNIEAKNMEEAIKIHYKKHPNIEPLYIVHKS
jgi:hypothetical protein